ncbi:MAG: hypothetical protein AAB268_01720 [Elusimicrobiota bacterium]
MSLSAGNLVGSLVFSSIGFWAFTYGRRTDRLQFAAMGGVLMAYSYFTPSAVSTWLVGAGLTGALYYLHD